MNRTLNETNRLILSILFLLIAFSFANAQQQTDTLTIFFDIDKSVVDVNHATQLDELIANQNVISISIYGYADFLGSVSYNQQLSEKRSTNVFNYLIERGFNRENFVISKGKGVYPNSSEKIRQDFSDKGIKAHRIVQVIYTSKSQEITIEEDVFVENASEENQSEENIGLNILSEEDFVVNNLIVLETLYFYGGTNIFRGYRSFRVLEELLKIMQTRSTLKIEIHGHICCRDHDLAHYPVSLKRAEAVYEYLVNNGIDPARMTYRGFGGTRKRYPLEENEYEQSMNMRVEVLIMEL